MKNFIHILVHSTLAPSADADAKRKEILDLAEDWMSYAPGAWILVSDDRPALWRDRFVKLHGRYGSVVVFPFDPNQMYAALPERIWAWFDKHDVLFERTDIPS